VPDEEDVARHILFNSYIRSSDGTVKFDAFLPRPEDLATSVTRHSKISEAQMLQDGQVMAAKLAKNYPGYARQRVGVITKIPSLTVVATPSADNPNHADIVGWAADKAGRKKQAMEIAQSVVLVSA